MEVGAAMDVQEKKGYCTLCRSRCGTINVVRGDQLVEVRPDREHPTGHAMCLKGKSAPELVHSPHRVLYPMRRTSKRPYPCTCAASTARNRWRSA